MNIEEAYEAYLSRIGRLADEKLGDDEAVLAKEMPTEQDSKFLQGMIKKQVAFNNGMMVLALVGLCIIFIIDIYFIFYYRDEPKTLAFLFSGTFVSLAGVITWLRKLWVQKSVFDVSMNVLQELDPVEAAKFIEVTYWKLLHK
jgi:hypothetical protein